MIDLLTTRSSHANLVEPAPTSEQLQSIVQAARRAPDHAWLRPTRFVTVAGGEREQLNDAFRRHAQLTGGTLAQIDKAATMANRAPLLIIAISSHVAHAKVPKWEQVATSSIALAYSQLAAESLGFGTIWRTGDMATSQVVRQLLHLADNEQIIGFLYIGTKQGSDKQRPEMADVLPVSTLSECLND